MKSSSAAIAETLRHVIVAETDRLRLRWLRSDDAPFILQLVNEPAWIRNIGNRNVSTVEAARSYIGNVARMYQDAGFGLNLVELRTGEPIGICGLLRRDTLPDADLGFAFISKVWGNGYALEAARAAMRHARESLGLSRVVAIVSSGNERSMRLLQKLGFDAEGMIQLQPDAEPLHLYGASP